MTSYNIIQGLFCLKIFEMIMVNRIVKQNFHNTSLRTSWLDNTKMFEIVKNQNFAAWWWLVQSFSLPTVSSFHSVTMVGKKKKELLAASDNKDNSFVPTTIFFQHSSMKHFADYRGSAWTVSSYVASFFCCLRHKTLWKCCEWVSQLTDVRILMKMMMMTFRLWWWFTFLN